MKKITIFLKSGAQVSFPGIATGTFGSHDFNIHTNEVKIHYLDPESIAMIIQTNEDQEDGS